MPLEPGANPGVCVKDRRDAVLFTVQKRGKYGGESNSSGGKSVKVLQADASSLRTRIARLEKRGNLDHPRVCGDHISIFALS